MLTGIDNELIKNFFREATSKLKKRYHEISATNKTVNSIGWGWDQSEGSGSIFGGGWLPYVDLGRAPKGVGKGGYYYSSPGNLADALQAWSDAKGLNISGYSLASSIAIRGTERWRAGADLGILSGFIEEIKPQIASLTKQLSEDLQTKITNYYVQRVSESKVIVKKLVI